MARATWSGNLSFGLVNVPVKLFTAVRSHDVRFRELHQSTMARVRRRRVDAETGKEVPADQIVKGHDVGDGRYVVIDPDELAALDPEASRTVEIHDFVDLEQIDPIFFNRPYYLAPADDTAAKPYRLLTEAMERAGRVAIASFVMRTKEYLAAIRARDGVLVLSTMHYADEVADPQDIEGVDALQDVEVGERELTMAGQLIDSLSTDFDPTAYHDTYQQRVLEVLESRAEGRDVTVEAPAEQPSGVIDLMSALEQSLQSAGAGGDRSARDTDAGDGRGPDYARMTRDQLYELAQERDLAGRSNMSKRDLVEALRRSEGGSSGRRHAS